MDTAAWATVEDWPTVEDSDTAEDWATVNVSIEKHLLKLEQRFLVRSALKTPSGQGLLGICDSK